MEKREMKKLIFLTPLLLSACATHTPAPKPEGKLFPINPNQQVVTEPYVDVQSYDLVTKSVDIKTKEKIIKDKPLISPKPSLRKKVEVVTEHKDKDENNKEVIKEVETTITTKQVVEPTVSPPIKSNKVSDNLFKLKD